MNAGHLISGALVSGDVPFTRSDTSTGQPLSANLISAAFVDQLVSSAELAKAPLQALPVEARTAALRQLADYLEAQSDHLVPLLIREIGCPMDQAAKLQIGSAAAVLRAMADVAEGFTFTTIRPGLRGGDVKIVKHPVGVCVGIVPWNVPLFLACVKLSAAITTGCPIILKPSPENASSMAILAKGLAELGLPEGSVQCVTGDRDLGVALVDHPGVSKVSFTGSTAAGRKVAAACAARLARCTLELGGKSAAIILEDADLDAVREQFFLATLQNNGQVCGAQSRILIPEHRQDHYIGWIGEMVSGLRVGDPTRSGVDIGPMATFAQADRVRGFLDRAEQHQVRRLVQTDYDTDLGAGYVPPTLLLTCADDEVAREEIFGPVLSVLTYRDVDEAVAMANQSAFGLSGSIWTPNIDRAAQIAERLETGTVGINSKKILDFGAPFGGFRSSGLGRELGPEGLDAYLEVSSILIPHHDGIKATDTSGVSVALNNDQPDREKTHV